MDPLNLVRFVEHDTAAATLDELTGTTCIELARGVTLHAGMRHGEPAFVILTGGDLSAVISLALADE